MPENGNNKITSKFFIDKEGYHIPKKTLTDKELKKIKKNLTVSPSNNMFSSEDLLYEQYKETDDDIIIPRFYGISKYGDAELKFNPEKSNLKFKSTLKDFQIPIVDTSVKHLIANKGSLINIPCGRGKTVMAINIAYKLGLKTLVIVHQSFLQTQWAERIKTFTGEKAGIIRQSIVDVDGKNIVVGMIQSIGSRDYGDIFDQFGLVIYDECHHYASQFFSKTASYLGAKYTLGLSATLYRKDGLVKIIHWHLGDIAYKERMKINNQVVVKIINYNSKNKKFKEVTRQVKGIKVADCTQMLSNLVDIKSRDDLLINTINALRKDPERKILVLSGRKLAHLPKLKDEVDASIKKDVIDGKLIEGECKTYYYTGDCKPKERKEAEDNADIIFGTFHMAQEGLDIPRLNTVILATPKKDVVQAVGRILRKELSNGDIRPLIIDISDNVSIFPNQMNVRERFYEQSEYILQYYYTSESKFLSPKEYITMQGGNPEGIWDKAPKDYDDVVKTDPVEFIEEDPTSSDSSSGSKSSTRSLKKKEKHKRVNDLGVDDMDDIFGF
jgi:superfamily II DNA or RNA helicase